MSSVRDLKDEAIVDETNAAGTPIEPKRVPKMSGAAIAGEAALPDPFPGRRPDAPREAGQTPRPTEKPGE